MQAPLMAAAVATTAALHGLCAAGWALRARDPRPSAPRGRWAAGVGVLGAGCATGAFFGAGLSPTTVSLAPGWPGVRLDSLSLVLFALVAVLGWVLVRFSQGYLAGNPRKGRFMAGLHATIAAVSVLVVAGDLVVLWSAWVVTGISLQRLLLFNPDRVRARVGAKKKLVTGRTADVLLAAAAAMIVRALGSAELGAIESLSPTAEAALAPGLQVSAWLLVLTAALACAQFPLHGWLPQILDAPTPVSALLHAGIVNAGGFLLLRLAPVVETAPGASVALTLVGGTSAIFGMAAMAQQASVKAKLAYSTVSQMGLMLFEIGLGAYALALVHLVAHSLFKGYAFLSAGSWLEHRDRDRGPTPPLRGRAFLAALALAALVVAAARAGLKSSRPPTAPEAVLSALVVLAVTHLVADGLCRRARGFELPVRIAGGFLLAGAYFAVEQGADTRLHIHRRADVGSVPQLAVFAGFAVVAAGAVLLALRHTRWGEGSRLHRHGYVALRRGLYMDARFDRMVGAGQEAREAAGRPQLLTTLPPAAAQGPPERPAVEEARP